MERKSRVVSACRRIRRVGVSLAVACGVLSGCIPVSGLATPEAEGRVIDAQTGRPIAAAEVYVETAPEIHALTDRDGTFFLHPVERMIWVSVLPRPIEAPPGRITVSAAGYRAESRELKGGTNVVEIKLSAVSGTATGTPAQNP